MRILSNMKDLKYQTSNNIVPILILLLALILGGCNKPDKKVFPYAFNKSNSLIFEIDKNTTNNVYRSQIVQLQSEKSLMVFDVILSELNFFSLNSKEQIHKTKINKEGPFGIKTANSVHYHNQDSIFVYSFQQGLFLINHLGHVVTKLDTFGEINESKLVEPAFPSSNSIYYDNGNILYTNYLGRLNPEQLYIYNTSFEVEKAFIPFPDIYNKDLNQAYYYSWFTINQSIIYLSMTLSNEIIVFDLNSRSIKKQYMGIENFSTPKKHYIENSLKFTAEPKAVEKMIKRMYKHPLYGPIIYNKKFNVLHRVCFMPVENRSDLYSGSYPRNLMIITSDLTGNILSQDVINNETGTLLAEFPEMTWFCHEGNIYIQIDNQNEDNIEFQKFVYEKK